MVSMTHGPWILKRPGIANPPLKTYAIRPLIGLQSVCPGIFGPLIQTA
jgi:hypothetical protein